MGIAPLRAQVPILRADTVRVVRSSADTVKTRDNGQSVTVKGIQYESADAAAALLGQKPLPLFAGVSVMVDLCGLVMATATPYGQYEAAARVNLRGRWFPIIELGIGSSDHTNETTNLHYKIHSPYYRMGFDYNVAKNPRALGRIFVGMRYGFSNYKYDVDGPAVFDPVYGTSYPFSFQGVKGNSHWCEAVFGLEAKVWGILHLGWSVRYRKRIHTKGTALDNPWYIPGYGKHDDHALGGTFNVIFDI